MDNSEEKTCFVPVYFIKGPKVGPLAGSRDVDTPTDLVLLTGFLHNIDKVSTIGPLFFGAHFHFLPALPKWQIMQKYSNTPQGQGFGMSES